MSTTTTPTIHLPPDVLKSLIEVFRNMGVARYTSTAGLVAMLYDWFLTVEDEIEVIWRKKMTLTSVLYLINRYLPIPALLMFNYHIADLRGPVSDDFCRAEIVLNFILWGICLALSSWLLFLRVISLWNQNKLVVYSVYILFACSHVATWIASGIALGQMYPSISYFKPVKVCGASSVASLPKVYWVLIALELYVFILQIVHHYTHARFRRKHNLPSFTLVKTLYNDGYIYYISVLHLRMFTCLVWEFGPGSLWYAGGQLEFSMTVALASRFHLHLRRAALGPTYTGVSYDITDQFAGKKGAKQYSMSTGTTTTATTATTTTAALDDGIPVPLSTITRSTGAGVGSLGVTMATRSGETDSSGNKREGGGEDRRIRFSYSEQRPVEVSWQGQGQGQEEEGAPRRSVTLRRLSGGLFGRTKETKNVDTERRGIERSQDGRRSGSQEETVERRRISKTYFDAVPLERGDLENPPVFTTSSAPTRTETSRETGVPGNMANWNPEERVTYEFDIGWDGDSNYLKSGTKDSQHPKRGLHAVAASKIGDVLSNLGGSSSSSRHGRQDEDQIGDHRNAR